jgi:hypothetical protein
VRGCNIGRLIPASLLTASLQLSRLEIHSPRCKGKHKKSETHIDIIAPKIDANQNPKKSTFFLPLFEGRLQICRAITAKFQVEYNLEIDAIQKQKADEKQIVPSERPMTYVENFNS